MWHYYHVIDTSMEWHQLSHFQVKNLSDEKQTLLASNKSVAEYNLSREPRLAQAKTQLAQTYEKAVEVQKSFEQNKQKLGMILIPYIYCKFFVFTCSMPFNLV